MSKEDIAKELHNAAMKSRPIAQFGTTYAMDLNTAYQIQELNVQHRLDMGDHISGIKLGFTSKAKMIQMGVHELIWGRLTHRMEYADGDSLSIDEFIHPRVEPEIAFRIKKKIIRPLSTSELPDYVEYVCTAMEVIDSRYHNFKFSLADVIADNCSSSSYILGKRLKSDTDISNLGIALKVNGQNRAIGSSGAIMGNPWRALLEASRITYKYGFQIEEGMIVMAGAATEAVAVNRSDKIEAYFEKCGSLKISF